MSSIIIKTPNWMGDVLFSLDLLYSLSKRFDRLGLIVSREHSELFKIFPIQGAEMIEYDQYRWPNLDPHTLAQIGDYKAEAGLLLTNSIGSALVLRYAGVSNLYGYGTEHRGFLLKKSLPRPEAALPQDEYYLNLLKLFDATVCRYPRAKNSHRRKLVIIHPGASRPERAWPLDRFVAIADHLAINGYEILFVSGAKLPITNHPLKIHPSLIDFCELLTECCLFIGNDSGPLHLAQQCGAPVIGIYGPGDPRITGPRSITPSKVIWHSYPCSPCRQRYFRECNPAPSGKPYCIETIGSREVIASISQILTEPLQEAFTR